VQAVRMEILRGLTDGRWVAQAVGLEILHALTSGPSEAPWEGNLAVADAEHVQRDGPGP